MIASSSPYLQPFVWRNQDGTTCVVLPATWGACHGSGFLGNAIREAETLWTHDHQAAWAGHIVVAAGIHDFGRGPEPAIVQAEMPKVVLSPARGHPDVIWATGQPLTAGQRSAGVREALSLVGHWYDVLAYPYFVLKVLRLKATGNLAHLLQDGSRLGDVICSGAAVRVEQAMRVPLDAAWTAATSDPDYIAPADFLAWGRSQRWLDHLPPADWK